MVYLDRQVLGELYTQPRKTVLRAEVSTPSSHSPAVVQVEEQRKKKLKPGHTVRHTRTLDTLQVEIKLGRRR